MLSWSAIGHRVLFHNELTAWAQALAVFLLAFTLLPLLARLVRAQSRHYTQRDVPLAWALVLELLDTTSRIFRWIVALYGAYELLYLPRRADRMFDIALVVGLWFQIGVWIAAATRFWLRRQQARTGDAQFSGTINIILFVLRLFIWSLVALLALASLGVSIGPLVAGLGVGGIAIALAVQTILGDLLASLSIAIDKPFLIGDLLRVDHFEGVAEQVGIKSTRLRSVGGEQIIIANADLLKSRMRNLSRVTEWRTYFTLLVPHDTAEDKLDLVPQLVAAAVHACPGVRFDSCLLAVILDTGLQFDTYYYVPATPAFDTLRIRDRVNRGIVHAFTQAGIAFALPTRALRFQGQKEPQQQVEQHAGTEVNRGQGENHPPRP